MIYLIIIFVLIFIIAILCFVFLKKSSPKILEKNNAKYDDVLAEISSLSKEGYDLIMNDPVNIAKKEISEDTLDLDDLFKTISIKAINSDNDFDFGLKRTNKKV